MEAMVKNNTKPRQKIIGNIYETFDYDMFKTLDGNRDVSKSHIAKLIKSMEESYLISPIIVNGKMEIIDGQHRYEAAILLELPIRYIIDKNADLRAVQLLNAKSKDWTPEDFMESYIKLGYEEYIKYKEFKLKYNIPHQTAQQLLSPISRCGQTRSHNFNSGEYKITRLELATKVAELMTQCLNFYDGSKRRSFVLALLSLSQKKQFNHKSFIHKLSLQKAKMYDCAKTSQYIELIEEIYNYRNKNKVNLRI